jgi:hypothetical protein
MLSNSVAAQLIYFQCYEIHSIPHVRFGLVYNEMGKKGAIAPKPKATWVVTKKAALRTLRAAFSSIKINPGTQST